MSDRGVGGRQVPDGLDAFVYTERGVYRTGETVHLTAIVRDARGIAAAPTPLTLVVERPDGVEYRRAVVNDQGLGGRSLDVPIVVDGLDRDLARPRLYRSQAPADRRNDLHGRGLRARPHRIRPDRGGQSDFAQRRRRK